MKTKSTNFKFSKKPLKSIKISNDKTKKNTNDYYSKIIMNLLEPLKIKEESKNSNENHGQKKIKLINKLKFSSNNSSNKLLNEWREKFYPLDKKIIPFDLLNK